MNSGILSSLFKYSSRCTTTTNTIATQQLLHNQQQYRYMSKFLSKAATKRAPLSPKHVRKGFYKGNGCTKEGTFRGKAGRFILDRSRMLELIIPSLEGFKLKPYISSTVPKWAPEDRRL